MGSSVTITPDTAPNPVTITPDEAPKKPGFGQRFMESSGLSGLIEAGKNAPQSMGEVFSQGLAPAKELASRAMAPAEHLGNLIDAFKSGDKDAVVSHASKLIDSFIPGTGNANELAQNTVKDVQQGNVGAVAGTASGLTAQLALMRGLSKAGMTKSALAKAAYTAEGDLSPVAKGLLHPTDLPESIFRKLVPEPAEQVAARDAYTNAKTITEAQEAAAKMDAIRTRQATAAARLEARNAPKPSPFGDATSTAPQSPTMITDSNGIRYVTASDGMKVSIPKSVADADAISYAGPKLAEQRQILSSIKSRPDMPQGNPTPFPTVQKLSDLKAGGTADDLISRTKKIVRPGEAPTAEDLKRAGDLTQVPLAKLRQLAAWGDELAKNELVRRLRIQ